MTDIIFKRVTDNKSKLNFLTHYVGQHFIKGDRILISVLGDQAAKYVDDLLWNLPGTSFLPHSISNSVCAERIVITTAAANVNEAHTLFNLQTHAHPSFAQFAVVYEFYDETLPEKTALSQQRLNHYPTHRFLT